MKLVTSAEMRALEQHAVADGISLLSLMRRAGQVIARHIIEVFPPIQEKSVIILVGPGNNGGDGLVAARHLKDAGALVSVYLLGERNNEDIVYREALSAGLAPIDVRLDIGLERLTQALTEADIVIDAVFGTGKLRAIEGDAAAVLKAVAAEKIRRPGPTIVAVDLPSGLNADTGAVDPLILMADLTVTLANPKRGLFLFPGADYSGSVSVADIGIPAGSDDEIITELLIDDAVASMLPLRPADANKGVFGKVMVIAGPPEFCGAPVLTCQAVYRAGAGLVTLAARRGLHPVLAAKVTETTHLLLPETNEGDLAPEAVAAITDRLREFNVLAIGPGFGKDPITSLFFHGVLAAMPPGVKMVLDADALNILAATPDWWQTLEVPFIMTPHLREMSRLTGLTVEQIQADRLGIARRYAELWQVVVVLKGAHAVIASPDGHVAVAPFANPGLATAGTGDVLTGIIAGFLAQGLNEFDAARTGVYIHGMAAETVREQIGDCGMISSDLLIHIPQSIKSLKEPQYAAGH